MPRLSVSIKAVLALLWFFALTSQSLAEDDREGMGEKRLVQEIEFKGIRFTDPAWVKSYLPLDCPCELTDDDLRNLQSKLLTTQVFQSVDFALSSIDAKNHKLTIELKEKWTVIPVIRGAYGGGTPLLVAGIYDSHFLGRLYTLGAETRTYGNSPTGGVAWFRIPRGRQGNHYLNFEVWRDNRIRSLFDESDEEIATLYGSALAINADALAPVPWIARHLQAGVRYQYRSQDVLEWDMRLREGKSLDLIQFDKEKTHTLQTRFVYDKVQVAQLNLSGFRVLVGGGPVFSELKTRSMWEQEIFYYKLWADDWNLAVHQYGSSTTGKSYQSLTFLGGFDSIRGIPDGVLVGNKAFYGNMEIRKVVKKAPYAWLQGAAYIDYGSAAMNWDELSESGRASFGMGMRLAIPQVHRLMFRLDYAWSVDRPGTSSISAGLNQFIDPYRPL